MRRTRVSMHDCMAQERAKKHLRVQAGTSGGNVPMPGRHLTVMHGFHSQMAREAFVVN